MGSIIKMFRTSKKHSDKENVPSVSFNTNSLKSSKPKLSEHVYAGEPSKNVDLRLKSPYCVLTAPKTTRGPRSCPGAPMDAEFEDRKKPMLTDKKNVMRYENVASNSVKNKRRVRDDTDLVQRRKSEFMNGRMSPSEIAYRNMLAREQYDKQISYESDDDELYEARIRMIESRNMHLETKLQKMHRRMNDERSTMTAQIEMLQEENYRLKKSHDRIHRQYSQMKTQLDTERKQKSDLLKMLHDANSKIELLEAVCDENENDESVNTSSLLLPYTAAPDLERSSDGAGEALCFPDSMNICSTTQTFGMFGSRGDTLVVNPMPNSLKDDMDTQDEVRIFRTSEMSDAGEISCSSPIETTRRGASPMFDSGKNIMFNSRNSAEVTRSHSDTDLLVPAKVELIDDGINRSEEVEDLGKPRYTRNSSWIKKNSEDLSTSDSEEERLSLIEKQLKKKGGLVKFNPPRQTVQAKHYKRFGKMERNALAEFEYLQDLSTDVSGIMSSPDVNQTAEMFSNQKLH